MEPWTGPVKHVYQLFPVQHDRCNKATQGHWVKLANKQLVKQESSQ